MASNIFNNSLLDKLTDWFLISSHIYKKQNKEELKAINLCDVMCWAFLKGQFANIKGRNGMQKKRIQNKRGVKITLNMNC